MSKNCNWCWYWCDVVYLPGSYKLLVQFGFYQLAEEELEELLKEVPNIAPLMSDFIVQEIMQRIDLSDNNFRPYDRCASNRHGLNTCGCIMWYSNYCLQLRPSYNCIDNYGLQSATSGPSASSRLSYERSSFQILKTRTHREVIIKNLGSVRHAIQFQFSVLAPGR